MLSSVPLGAGLGGGDGLGHVRSVILRDRQHDEVLVEAPVDEPRRGITVRSDFAEMRPRSATAASGSNSTL
jgi:hypothetical protein